jgi:hypothetical protein
VSRLLLELIQDEAKMMLEAWSLIFREPEAFVWSSIRRLLSGLTKYCRT